MTHSSWPGACSSPKGVDPSLALYAAYAYHDLQRRDLIKEMQSFLRDDLGLAFFDIALLSGDRPGGLPGRTGCCRHSQCSLKAGPCCRRFRVKLPGFLSSSFNNICCRALWTMFDQGGVAKLTAAIQSRGDTLMKQLVFVHGRAQENKDAVALKAEWVTAFREGLAKNQLQLPIPEEAIRFPYYGQTLYDLVSDKPPDQVAAVIVKGDNADDDERAFVRAVIQESKTEGRDQRRKARGDHGTRRCHEGPVELGVAPRVLKAIESLSCHSRAEQVSRWPPTMLYQYLKQHRLPRMKSRWREAGDTARCADRRGESLAGHRCFLQPAAPRRQKRTGGWYRFILRWVRRWRLRRSRSGSHQTKHPECVGKWFQRNGRARRCRSLSSRCGEFTGKEKRKRERCKGRISCNRESPAVAQIRQPPEEVA